jgi:hypothetical protein
VDCPDAASWNIECPAGVTAILQANNTIVECHVNDSRHIFSNNPSGPELLNNPEHFRPEKTVILVALSLPGTTKRLAGKSTGQ